MYASGGAAAKRRAIASTRPTAGPPSAPSTIELRKPVSRSVLHAPLDASAPKASAASSVTGSRSAKIASSSGARMRSGSASRAAATTAAPAPFASSRRRFATSSAASPAKRPTAVASTSSTRMCSLARSRSRATSAVSNARVSVRASAARIASPRAPISAARLVPAASRRACAAAAAASNASSAGATAVRRTWSTSAGVSSASASNASASAARVATRRASAAARRSRERPVVATSDASSAPRNSRKRLWAISASSCVEQTFGVLARGERIHGRAGRVLRRLRDDALRRDLPRLTLERARGRVVIEFSLRCAGRRTPQVDLRLHDEDRLDVAPHDAQKRRVAFGERLLRVDQVQHRVGAGQIRQRRTAVRRVDRREPWGVRDHEPAFQKRRVHGDPHEHRRPGVLLVGRIVQLALFADRDEPCQPPERDALLAPVRVHRRRGLVRGVRKLRDRCRRGVDVGREKARDALAAGPLLELHFAQQRVEQERLPAGELAHDGEHEATVTQARRGAREHGGIVGVVAAPLRLGGDEPEQLVQTRGDVVARAAIAF